MRKLKISFVSGGTHKLRVFYVIGRYAQDLTHMLKVFFDIGR